VATQKCLVWEPEGDLLGHGNVGEQHKLKNRRKTLSQPYEQAGEEQRHPNLFDKFFGFFALFYLAIVGHALVVQAEVDLYLINPQRPVVEAPRAKLARKSLSHNQHMQKLSLENGKRSHVESLDIRFYASSILAISNLNLRRKVLSLDDFLSIRVRKLGGRPAQERSAR
jgi:hypothetical protein